jgi:hypothetical protein
LILDIFDEQEKDLIRREFNYAEDSDTVRNSDPEFALKKLDELNTEFTEYSIDSRDSKRLLKNESSKSVIYCPFNTA